MTKKYRMLSYAASVGALLALAGCGGLTAANVGSATTTAENDVTAAEGYVNADLTVAEAALAAYKATPNPSQAVITEATKLDTEAQAAANQYGPEASAAIAAVGSLTTYLLTAAPGNGVTPASVPTTTGG